MGLQEKRAIKSFQDTNFVSLVKEVNTVAGYELQYEVDWDSLAVADSAGLYEEGFSKVYFLPLKAALKEITIDDVGREALKKNLHKIVIKNKGDIYYADRAYTFADGILTINHSPVTNIDDVPERTQYLTDLLSSKL